MFFGGVYQCRRNSERVTTCTKFVENRSDLYLFSIHQVHVRTNTQHLTISECIVYTVEETALIHQEKKKKNCVQNPSEDIQCSVYDLLHDVYRNRLSGRYIHANVVTYISVTLRLACVYLMGIKY